MAYSPELKALAKQFDHGLFNREKLFAQNPTLLNDKINPYGIKFYEHPSFGDEAPVIADFKDVSWNCTFYDPWNSTDQAYISEQAQELGLIDASIDVWADLEAAIAKSKGVQP